MDTQALSRVAIYTNTPYFLDVRNLMTTILNLGYITIVDINVSTLREISYYIRSSSVEIFSKMKIEI